MIFDCVNENGKDQHLLTAIKLYAKLVCYLPLVNDALQ